MFRVKWNRRAVNQLMTIWLNAADQNAVTSASHEIDQILTQDPANEGESRPNQTRLIFASPLAVRYRVYPDRKFVLWPAGRFARFEIPVRPISIIDSRRARAARIYRELISAFSFSACFAAARRF